jgi:hypothetical protein
VRAATSAHYPATVDEVVAVEPEPYLRERARTAAAEARVHEFDAIGLAGLGRLDRRSRAAVV